MDFLATMDLGMLAAIVIVLFVIASLIFGWMIFYLTRSKTKDAPRHAQAKPSASPTVPPSPPVTRDAGPPEEKKSELPLREQFAALSNVSRRASATPVEVMRLLRDRVTGALIVEVEGEKYRTLREIKDGQIGRRVLQTAADLVRFTEVMKPPERTRIRQPANSYSAEPSPTASPPAPSTLALEVAPALEQETPVPRTPAPPSVEREFLQSLADQMREEQGEREKPSLSPIEFFRRGFAARRKADLQSEMPVVRNFVEEIEDILQRFVRTYPSFIGKEVHVRTGQDGGVEIQVEEEFYNSPDDIPDPEIRGILKAAIQEWEKS
jgi:hypothetical protein